MPPVKPTVVAWTSKIDTAVQVAATLRAAGLKPQEDLVAGTLLPNGTFVDNDLLQPSPIEWFRERFGRRRRRFAIGVRLTIPDAKWEEEETKDGLLKTIAVAGLVWPGIDVQDIAIDREGLAWPPRPADPTKPAT